MREVIVKLYQFDELSDKAKDRARQWYRECEAQDFGGFGELFEPAETAAKLLGITFGTDTVKLRGGGTRTEPKISWSLDYSHIPGVCFDGTYQYVKGSARAIRKEFPTAEPLHRVADGLAALQNKYKRHLTATITQDRDGERMGLDLAQYETVKGYFPVEEQDEATLLQLFRDFARWIFKGIEAEYEYRMSDEQIEDSIRANEYDFRESGERSDG